VTRARPMRPSLAALAVAVASCLHASAATAGRPCEPARLTVDGLKHAVNFAAAVHHRLEEQHRREGTDLVLIARAGQDLRKYHLRFSHMAFAYRTRLENGSAAWRVLHKLNACGTAQSSVYRQGLAEFFLDDLWKLEAGWMTFSPETQARLLAVLREDRRITILHEANYSVVSYPWATRYQQSNQWLIETLASSFLEDPVSRSAAQQWLARNGYTPTTLHLGALTRLGGRVSAANVSFDDHPSELRFSGRIQTVTADSVFHWLQRAGLGRGELVYLNH